MKYIIDENKVAIKENYTVFSVNHKICACEKVRYL